MKLQKAILFLFSTFAAVMLFSTVASADPCQDAIAAAAKKIADKGGACKTQAAKFKSSKESANRACRGVRDTIKRCWSSYRSSIKSCSSLRIRDRVPCRLKKADVRKSCVSRARNSTNGQICKDKRRFAVAGGFKVSGACAAPAIGAYMVCTAYWLGVFVKAATGG
ncbi:MAG TPA: hypothetical protein DCE42_01850 [Myxococcales bacterium]|nr:hypothetical protein [Deltaproteobacteria bacterium]MBU52892.1 hypothetical protein [Deltaproteobacteria bacterium]HAA53467.1 hypothetical protein [Myxococcales bacterium]|tara:strand:- start:36464 stop:36961 length:498 start_codon:yes stop_codon:yes gene_type:complete